VVPLDDVAAVKTEITAQLTTFRRLLGRDPTHIDSHQHVHVREPTRSALLDVAAELYIPIRHLRSEVRYCGNFYGQTAEGFPRPDFISVQAVVKILEALPEGFTELGCHPGEGNDLDTMYRGERAQELKVLCDPQIRTTIDDIGIELCSFAKLPADWHRSKVLV
jgi:chitin disaccharide deacetylase